MIDGTYAYAIGGRNLKSSANNNHLQRFDPATGQWTQLTPLPVANSDMGAVYVDGQIVTFGGENAFSVFNTVRDYNMATKSLVHAAEHGPGAARDGRGGGREHHLRHRRSIAARARRIHPHACSSSTSRSLSEPRPAALTRRGPGYLVRRPGRRRQRAAWRDAAVRGAGTR